MAENPRIEELRRRVQADPASIAFAALAEEFRRIGRFEDAIETCRAGLQRHPAYLSARVTLGRALIETGEYDAAREELETVLRSAPENLAAIRGIAQIHERLGHSTELHPDLAAMMQPQATQPIKIASPPPAPPPAPPAPPAPAPIALAPEPPRHVQPEPEPEPVADPEPAASLDFVPNPIAPPDTAPASFDHFDLSVGESPAAAEETASAPFDIFAAALNKTSAPASPPPASDPFAMPAADAAPQPAPPFAFEPATIAFEAPAAEIPQALPDPHVAAMLSRLEQFLNAIQNARHA
jgi:tetratricopeptide (TPR) repeat protein